MAKPNLTTLIEAAKSVNLDWIRARVSITPTGCWEWIGTKDKDGYGRFRRNYSTVRVARVVLALLHGSSALDDGAVACHRCDNPPCCNPDHLYVGSQSANIRDAIERGRYVPPQCGCDGKCKHGHEWTPENTAYTRGFRRCRQCSRARQRGYEKAAEARWKKGKQQ